MNSKIVISIIICMTMAFSLQSFAQKGRNKSKKSFMMGDRPARWVMGIKAGINKTNLNIDNRFSVLRPLNTTMEDKSGKAYDKKNPFGSQTGLMLTFLPINTLGVSFQPSFISFKYGYKNHYEWLAEETMAPTYTQRFTFSHTLNYLDLPLMLKYYLINGNIHAFVQGGGFYSKLLNAKKTVYSTMTEDPEGEAVSSSSAKQSMDVNDLFIRTNAGWIAGGGVGFKADNFRLALEVNYRKGANNVTNEKKRYSNDLLVNAYYDTPDDISTRNLEISFSCSLPLDNLVHVVKKAEPASKKR